MLLRQSSAVVRRILQSLPLPTPNAERIVQLRELSSTGGQMLFAEPNYLDLRARSIFGAIAQYSGGTTTVTGGSEPARAMRFRVSGDFFRVLGIQPFLGRTFAVEDSKPGAVPVVVISYDFWRRVLGEKSDLNGTALRISDKSFTVVGVMPPGFSFRRTQKFGSRENYLYPKPHARPTTGM